MHQLLSELEHCHSHSIIHRDIECANLLVNNEGILEISDFGLANTWNPDLWSVGCVLAELFLGKPLLRGRTKYFRARSYACEPSSLPKYQPNKEIDSKDDAAVGEGVSESLAPCQGLQILIIFVNFKIEFYVRTCEFEILTNLEGSFHVTRASEISRDALCHSFCYSFVLLT
ncbi:cell division control protein 2 homolog isoform X1 [Zingiber officinale]|uniref:cell division control protein 2 homolog isoform X1 n=1 Tax=Zingiber officinale TaxID=94328 RepID=UPI001C4B698B|nr:cell division control protein 2 homolog isoform X1 [Zingiber officinale]